MSESDADDWKPFSAVPEYSIEKGVPMPDDPPKPAKRTQAWRDLAATWVTGDSILVHTLAEKQNIRSFMTRRGIATFAKKYSDRDLPDPVDPWGDVPNNFKCPDCHLNKRDMAERFSRKQASLSTTNARWRIWRIEDDGDV